MAVTNQLLMFAETFSKGSTSTGPDGGGLFAVDPTDGSDAGLAESRATGRPLLREFLDHVAELEREDATIRTGGRQRAGGANNSAVSRTITTPQLWLPIVLVMDQPSAEGWLLSAQEKVVVTTVHKAKGLEWDVVFVVRMNEGVMPLHTRRRSDSDGAAEDIDEEER